MTYGYSPEKLSELQLFRSREEQDYPSSPPVHIYGYDDHHLYTYEDDFTWNYVADDACKFPMRSIYSWSGDSLHRDWSYSLDLFGIPCD